MFRDPLYYIPVEANRLYDAKKGSREYKTALRELSKWLNMVEFLTFEDERAKRIAARIKRRLILVFVLAFTALGCAAGFAISEKFSENVAVVLFLLTIGLTAILGFVTVRIVHLRRKLVLMMLESYKPVCREFSEEVLSAVGMSCLSAVGNAEAIGCGYFEDCDESEEGEFEDCFCVNCGASIVRTRITDFDEHESAVCPQCGMSTVVIAPVTSDEFREKLCKYYREVSAS